MNIPISPPTKKPPSMRVSDCCWICDFRGEHVFSTGNFVCANDDFNRPVVSPHHICDAFTYKGIKRPVNGIFPQIKQLKVWLNAERVESTRKVFRAVTQHIRAHDEGSVDTFRWFIYHRLHFDTWDYSDLCHHGMQMLNLLSARENVEKK